MYFEHPAILLLLWILPLRGGLAGLCPAQAGGGGAAVRRVGDGRAADAAVGRRAAVDQGGAVLAVWRRLSWRRPGRGSACISRKSSSAASIASCCLDVSRSMLAEDVAPNRLERAKSDIRDLLKKLAGDRVGLIVFAGKAGAESAADDRRRLLPRGARRSGHAQRRAAAR